MKHVETSTCRREAQSATEGSQDEDEARFGSDCIGRGGLGNGGLEYAQCSRRRWHAANCPAGLTRLWQDAHGVADRYWRWFLGSDQNPAQSMVGNVKLMPNPDQEFSGEGTEENPLLVIGELEITLRPGTPFVLPLFATYGETYNNGTPDDDPALYADRLETISMHLTIDGRMVVSDANKAAFYVPATDFDPPVAYPESTDYGSVAAIWFLGVGIVSPPLSVGQHVIRLDGTDIVPGVYSVIFQNTWHVTVTPR